MPKVQSDLEQLLLSNIRTLVQIFEAFTCILLQNIDILIGLLRVARGLNQCQILGEDRSDGDTDLLRKVLEVNLASRFLKGFVFISEVSVFSNMSNLFDENAIKHTDFFFIHDLIIFFFIFEINL